MKYCIACPTKEISNRATYCDSKCRSLYLSYGMGLDDYQRLFDAQKGRCAICHNKQHIKSLAVDHDHYKGPEGSTPEELRASVRGLICQRCNTLVLAAVRHRAEFALSVYQFLSNPPAQEILGVER